MSDLNIHDVVSNHDDPEEIFDLVEQLGEGAYGTVWKGMHRPTGTIVAIKVIEIQNEIYAIKKEISILKECKHPAIVAYKGSYIKDGDLWLIMEYCSAGSVADIIRCRKHPLNEL